MALWDMSHDPVLSNLKMVHTSVDDDNSEESDHSDACVSLDS